MLTVELDKSRGKNLYMQLYEGIRRQILDQTLTKGTRLPSKRALASHLGISVKTVENAYYQLQLEGYISSKVKSGFYVNELNDYRTAGKKKEPFETRFREESYKIDFHSNKNKPAMFPASTWCRLMRESISYTDESLFDTVPFNGIPELRIAIAEYLLQVKGIDISPDRIIIGAGTEFLYGRLIQLLGRDITYAVEDPSYVKIKGIYKVNDVECAAVPVDEEGICTDLLEQSEAGAVHLSPAHHFPLGTVTGINRRVQLLKWANRKPGRYIIEDDYDSEFRYVGHPIRPLMSIDINEKVIYMNTFSKTVSPSVRVSYMILPQKLVKKYVETMNYYSCTVSRIEQLTLAKFISGGHMERYIRSVTRYDSETRKMFLSAIRNSSFGGDVQIKEDTSGSHILMKLPVDIEDSTLTDWFKTRGINVSCVSEYFVSSCDERYLSTLILNYAGIDEEKTGYFIKTMVELKKEFFC